MAVTQMGRIETGLNALLAWRDEVNSALHTLTTLTSRVDRFEILLDETRVSVKIIAEGHSVLAERLDRVEQRLDRVEKRLDAVERRLDAIEARLVVLTAAVERIERALRLRNRRPPRRRRG